MVVTVLFAGQLQSKPSEVTVDNLKQHSIRMAVKQTLIEADLSYDDNVVNLLLGTMAVESDFGRYVKQIGGGPALGVFQCEPATRRDIDEHYLKYKPELRQQLKDYIEVDDIEFMLSFDIQVVYAYLHYERYGAFDEINCDIMSYALVWKRYYNTRLGKGTIQGFIGKYWEYVDDGRIN